MSAAFAADPMYSLDVVCGGALPHRFRRYAAVAEAVWAQGWRSCADDDERGQWLVLYTEWLNNQLDQ
jgi:hypothetical protein